MLEFTRGLNALAASTFDALATARAMALLEASDDIFSDGLLRNVLRRQKYGENGEERVELVEAVRGKGVEAVIILARALRKNNFHEQAAVIEAGITKTLVNSTTADSESALKSAIQYHAYLVQFQADQLPKFFKQLQENKMLYENVKAKASASTGAVSLLSTAKVYGNVPYYPRYQDDRCNDDKEKIEKACAEMFKQKRDSILVKGEGAIGKSLLVSHSFVQNEAFLQKYCIGNVYWLNTWAYSNDVDLMFKKLIELGQSTSEKNVENSKAKFISRLKATSSPNCRTLIVLDDVYKSEIYAQASNLANHVYMIAVSRDQNVNEENRFVEMSPVGDEFFFSLFSPFKSLLSPDDLKRLVDRCAGLPLIGQLIAAQFRKYRTKLTATEICSEILRQRKVEIKGDWDLDRKFAKIYETFLIGLDEASQLQSRFLAFLIYPKGASVPLAELAVLWQLPIEEAAVVALELQSRSWARATDANIETLSIHDYLYDVALEFAFDTLEPVKNDLLGVRRALLRKYGGAVLTAAVRMAGSYDLVNNLMTVLLSTSGQPKDIEMTIFDVCGFPSTLAAFFENDILRFPGRPYESNFSIRFVCKLLEGMLVCNKTKAMAVIKSEGLLSKLKATNANGRKATENALFLSVRCLRLLDCLIDNDADTRVIDDEGNTVIMYASSRNADVALKKLLTRCGDMINNVNVNGDSAIHLACQRGFKHPAMVLLKFNKLKLGVRNKAQKTAFQLAMARSGMEDVCRKMRELYPELQSGASMTENDSNWPPLATAVCRGNFDRADELLANGADFSIRVDGLLGTAWRRQLTLLHLAAFNGDVRSTTVLTNKGLPVDARTENQATPLYIAAEMGHDQIVELLAGKDADVNARTDDQATPLWIAAQNGHHHIVEFLAGKGADVNARTDDQATPLHIAAQNGHHLVVAFLAGKGADVNARADDQVTPLFIAALNGHHQIVEFLAGKGADVNARRDDQVTPLYFAALNGHHQIVEFLAGKGADVNART